MDVGVVTLQPLAKPYIDVPFAFLEKFLVVMFREKRKRIRNSLRRLFPLNCDQKK